MSNNGLTASRPRTLGEFNHAIVITNRPMREGEMFEVKIETLVDRWSGSIEAGRFHKGGTKTRCLTILYLSYLFFRTFDFAPLPFIFLLYFGNFFQWRTRVFRCFNPP